MADIAFEIGYTDSAVFSRAFRNYYGMSPAAYRKKQSTNCKENREKALYNKHEKKNKWVLNADSLKGEVGLESFPIDQSVSASVCG